MKTQTKRALQMTLAAMLSGVGTIVTAQTGTVDLLARYPARLTAGDLVPVRARPWQFTENDIFHLSNLTLSVGKGLKISIGQADIGIGHCKDGAVWAVVMPRQNGTLTSSAATGTEDIAHVWLRFHPKEVNTLFPPETLSSDCNRSLLEQMQAIANHKLRASYHAGMNVMIPDRKDLTVDVDTKTGPRRFFVVDTKAQTAQYVNAFEKQKVNLNSATGS